MLSVLSSTKQIAKDFLASRLWPKRPQSVLVEITAACDARCVHCPRLAMDRAMKPMPLPLWRKLVDEAAALGVPEFIPNGYGEICTIPVPHEKHRARQGREIWLCERCNNWKPPTFGSRLWV